MTLKALTKPQARACVRLSLGLRDDCADADSRFELVRSIIWSQSSANAPVHVARVLSAALPPWRLLCGKPDPSEEELREELHATLTALFDAGDLVELPGGRWTAATTRLVRLEHEGEFLLIGGAPISALPIDAKGVRFHGPYRHVLASTELCTIIQEEELASWARLPVGSLSDWTRDRLESLERRAYSPASHENFEFYQPANARAGAPQFNRWFEDLGTKTETLLARRTRTYGAREYRLVDTFAGRIIRACELSTSEVRRLMYALDLQAKNPVIARVSARRDETEIVLSSELPWPEQRILAAIGNLEIPERPFQRRWTFRRGKDRALKLLQSLGIEILPITNKGVRR